MQKILRYSLVFLFWFVAAGSFMDGYLVDGMICIPFIVVSVAYPDFYKEDRIRIYWTLVAAGFFLMLYILYQQGLDY